jgi:cell division protein FtsB
MKLKRPKITTMLIVFALIIYGGVLIVNIQAETQIGQDINRELALEAARLEIEVAELEFAIDRYMAYETARIALESLLEDLAATEDKIAELENAILHAIPIEDEELDILIHDAAQIEERIAAAEIERVRLETELEEATANFNSVDVADVIAEIARTHLGLEMQGEIILHETN